MQIKELQNYKAKTIKREQQDNYRNLLNAQANPNFINSGYFESKANSNKNMKVYGFVSNETNPFPYRKPHNYNLGSTDLKHNPIINPTPNYGYNKYLVNGYTNQYPLESPYDMQYTNSSNPLEYMK